MINLLTIIGARPQIIKAAAFSRAVASHNAKHPDTPVREWILHTGQHYDENMSGVFFGELGIPQPDFNLGVGSGGHGEQTARMIDGIEKVLTGKLADRNGVCHTDWDGVVLYGDTNSTLAGAVAASKLHIPVFHIEAGLRSFNMAMPEEVNRIVCDQLSSILFAPTRTAVDNLREEGFFDEKREFRKVINCGDIMYDNTLYFSGMAPENKYGDYVLATVHRQENTDDKDRLKNIFDALSKIAESTKVVLPLHPRTAKVLTANNIDTSKLTIVPPASYLETLSLEQHAKLVLTDSGGVQKEAFFLERPCIILRDETEWVEIIRNGAGILTGSSCEKILEAYSELKGKKIQFPKLFGDGKAAGKILETIWLLVSSSPGTSICRTENKNFGMRTTLI